MTRLQAQGLALIVGIAGGFVAYGLGVPLPWMLGPMIANTIVAMTGVAVAAPIRLRPVVMPVIGVMLGSAITAEMFGVLGSWIVTLLVMPVFLAAAAATSYGIYRKLGGYDQVTAFYAAMPGGLNDMVVLGAEAGGVERRIALAHAARILIVVSFVVLFFSRFLGVNSNESAGAAWVGMTALSVADYAILAACAVLGMLLGKRAGLPAAPVFGPMILSGIAHVAGWVTVPPPSLLVIAAQVCLGTIIGTRFAGATLREVRRDLALAAVATSTMLVVAIIFAEIITVASGIPLSQSFLAYSPGGLTEMSLLTLALDQDVAYVSVMHVIRITIVIGAAPLVFRLLRR